MFESDDKPENRCKITKMDVNRRKTTITLDTIGVKSRLISICIQKKNNHLQKICRNCQHDGALRKTFEDDC